MSLGRFRHRARPGASTFDAQTDAHFPGTISFKPGSTGTRPVAARLCEKGFTDFNRS